MCNAVFQVDISYNAVPVCHTTSIGGMYNYSFTMQVYAYHSCRPLYEHLNPTGCISGLKTNLHVPATSWFSKGAQMSTSEKLRFVVLSPSHEKLTNTHPLLGGGATGVAVGKMGAICTGDGDGDGDSVEDTAIVDGAGTVAEFSCDKTQ